MIEVMALSPLVAGSKLSPLTAASAAETKGSLPSSTSTARTRPSGPIVVLTTTTASPVAPGGYVGLGGASIRGGTSAGSAAAAGALHRAHSISARSRQESRLISATPSGPPSARRGAELHAAGRFSFCGSVAEKK